MVIAIRGAGTKNKGAQLMLEAVVDRLGGKFTLAVTPQSANYVERAQLGLTHTIYNYRAPVLTTKFGDLLPDQFRERYGITSAKEVKGVIDISGFKFSDNFHLDAIRSEAKLARYLADKGKPIVMAPQAFGPFADTSKAEWSKVMLDSATQIYVRDRQSAEMIESLNISTPVKRSPDFTIGLDPDEIERVSPRPFAAIVPNMKMIEVKGLRESDYLRQLTAYANAARRNDLDVVIVIHERGDTSIATTLAEEIGATIYRSEKPRELKAALGQAELVVSSRFHAIVGSLSQVIPTIALGWSHKYGEVLFDFGVEDWIDDGEVDPNTFMKSVLQDTTGLERIKNQKEVLLQQMEDMWQEIDGIFLGRGPQ